MWGVFLILLSQALTIKPIQTPQRDYIRVNWAYYDGVLGLRVRNISDHSIEILWEKCLYIDPVGREHRVFHKNWGIENHSLVQSPTILKPGEFLTDYVIPSDYVYWANGWKITPLFPQDDIGFKGKTIKVLLVIKASEKEDSLWYGFTITN